MNHLGSLVDWSLKMEAIIGQVNLDDVHNGADAVLAVSYCRCKNHTHICGTCTTIQTIPSSTHYKNTHNLADIQHKQLCDRQRIHLSKGNCTETI